MKLRTIVSITLSVVSYIAPPATATEEKFLPPARGDAGLVGCFVEGKGREYAQAVVVVKYANLDSPRADWTVIIARRNNQKQLELDCAKWFTEMAATESVK